MQNQLANTIGVHDGPNVYVGYGLAIQKTNLGPTWAKHW